MSKRFGDAARLGAIVIAAACAAASTSSRNGPVNTTPAYMQPPPPQQMELPRALGLWKSSFGAVKIEENLFAGAPASGSQQGGQLQGVWLYQRDGQDVIGYFNGTLRGNVLDFTWHEPSVAAPLTGHGYLAFDPSGQGFTGRWWTDNRDRSGDWTGWRQPTPMQPAPITPAEPYGADGGATYGYPPPAPAQPPYY